jgi:hypothetical protein
VTPFFLRKYTDVSEQPTAATFKSEVEAKHETIRKQAATAAFPDALIV